MLNGLFTSTWLCHVISIRHPLWTNLNNMLNGSWGPCMTLWYDLMRWRFDKKLGGETSGFFCGHFSVSPRVWMVLLISIGLSTDWGNPIVSNSGNQYHLQSLIVIIYPANLYQKKSFFFAGYLRLALSWWIWISCFNSPNIPMKTTAPAGCNQRCAPAVAVIGHCPGAWWGGFLWLKIWRMSHKLAMKWMAKWEETTEF